MATERAGFDYLDRFDDNANQWHQGDLDNEAWVGSIAVEDGVLLWSIDEAKRGFSYWTFSSVLPAAADFDVYVDVRLSGYSRSGLSAGLQFRQTFSAGKSAYYAFFVADDGQFSVQRWDPAADDWTVLVQWTDTDDYVSGRWNTLGVSARGDHFVLTINDRTVGSFSDAHLDRGDVSLAISAGPGENGMIWFDNFALQLR
jgi:hypothetical protein